MLAFITTDVSISAAKLNKIVKRVIDMTFNNLTVDGTPLPMIWFCACKRGIGCGNPYGIRAGSFPERTFTVCNDLCKKIAADGEGATKRVEIRVAGR